MNNPQRVLFLFTWGLFLMSRLEVKSAAMAANPSAFVAYQPAQDFSLMPIVLQYDPTAKTGANWAEVNHPAYYNTTPPMIMGRAAIYLREGLRRMTGKDFPVVSTNDLSKGIVLTLFKDASPDIRHDPQVQQALKEDSKDLYAANEAFYIRSEKDRVLVVANTPNGLTDAVVELLESTGYEVLGMGPDWIYVPDYRTKPLVFSVNRAGRPSFYLRQVWPHSGQNYGQGTIYQELPDPADENVDTSYFRWLIGTRMFGTSMPLFPGHALHVYHRRIMDKMIETGSTHGFYADVGVGLAATRPPAGPELKNHWWINSDPKGTPGFEQTFSCDGKEWQLHPSTDYFGAKADVTSPLVRQIVFDDMKVQAEAAFKANPSEPFIFPTEVEDGGVDEGEWARTMADKNWYPEYLAREKLPFGRPYTLNGYKGLNQPKEIWDSASASDHAFAFADYLLHEFDMWIDSLPKDQQVTSTGKSKKELVRCSFLSYGYNDVPPDFNPDRRIRIEVAPFPKHRGIGKWEKLATQEDVARALHLMLPGEPSADYGFYSFSFYYDGAPEGIPASWSGSPEVLTGIFHRAYESGCRAINRETDFNFGKYGLGYYLTAKLLWNVKLTAKDLDALRDRWFQRAYGSVWKEMKAYYDFMLPENYPVNSPNTWAKAIRLIDDADKKLDGAKEPDAQRRLDDLKQYWYAHYLMDSGKYTVSSPEVKEFLWKGQMSYMTGMQGLLGRVFKSADVKAVVGPQISAGPAHYTDAETQAWWAQILDFWKVTPVKLFSEATLANGKPAKEVDVNDLVRVDEFQTTIADVPFLYNSGVTQATVLIAANRKNDPIGFKLVWPFDPSDNFYAAKKLHYGVERWDATSLKWEPWLDKSTTTQMSVEVDGPPTNGPGGGKLQVVDVELKAPRPGVYRFSIGYGGNLSVLGSPAYDPVTGSYASPMGFSFPTDGSGLSQSGVYIYIPKGTPSLDLDVWDTGNVKSVTFYQGLPKNKMTVSRKVDIGKMGVHTIALQPGEAGSFALVEGNNFFFPYLYSVPTLWAKSTSALLVPRAIAEADGLTILGDPSGHQVP